MNKIQDARTHVLEINRSRKLIRQLSFLLLLTGAVGFAFAQTSLPRAPGARVISISPPAVHASEPSIAVNPNNPSQVVAVYQPATVAYSTDSAQTFTLADLPPVPYWKGGGDVSVTFDNKGHAFL
ncbi:MAG: hypothetical protein WBD23_09455, partial [Candidatus Acidiferrales bacterium]